MHRSGYGTLMSAATALVIVGTLTGEGVECPVMRGEDGRVYSLSRLPKDIEIGDKIEVTGEAQLVSICQQGTTISISSLKVLNRSGSGKTWKR